MRCATHPEVETNLRCGKCGKPICPRCMVQTPVGARCPDCARLYKLPTYRVSAMHYLKASGVALGLAIACGFSFAFTREYLDPTFFSSNQLESIVKLPVLVSIPIVNTKKEHQRNIVKIAGATTALVSMSSILFYELFILWKTVPSAFSFTLG